MRGRIGVSLLLLLLWASTAGAQVGKNYKDITSGGATDTTAVHMADSSGVIKLLGQFPRFIAFKAFATGASAQTTSQFAISVRWHRDGGGDSTSVYTLPVLSRSSIGASATTDSVTKIGDLVTATATSAPWSDEVVLSLDRNRAVFHPRYGYLINIEQYWGNLTGLDAISVKWRHLHGPGVATTSIKLVVSK